MRRIPKEEIEANSWLGPVHLPAERLRAFVQGKIQLEEQEHAHIIVCPKCSHKIADWVLARVEEGGEDPSKTQ